MLKVLCLWFIHGSFCVHFFFMLLIYLLGILEIKCVLLNSSSESASSVHCLCLSSQVNFCISSLIIFAIVAVHGYGQDYLQTHYCSQLVQCYMGMERDYGTAILQIMYALL